MRSALLAACLAAAGCATTSRAPEIPGAPERLLESSLESIAPAAPPEAGRAATYRCLFVFNDSSEEAALFVDGRHVGWVGPRSSAGFYVGRSAGTKTRLAATCPSGTWSATVDGPAWDVSWRLRERN